MTFVGIVSALWIACLVFFPKQCGREARDIFDRFMQGWNDRK